MCANGHRHIEAQSGDAAAAALGFWIIKLLTTTFSETAGDADSMMLNLGDIVGIAIFLFALAMLVAAVHGPCAEIYRWLTTTLSPTLGAGLGDWLADGSFYYLGAAAIFGAALAVIALLYYRSTVSHVDLLCAAFILTHLLGATVGDFLDKPVAQGGLEFSRSLASLVLVVAIVGMILIIPQKAQRRAAHD